MDGEGQRCVKGRGGVRVCVCGGVIMRRRDQMQETGRQERETRQSIGGRRKRSHEAEPKRCQLKVFQ